MGVVALTIPVQAALLLLTLFPLSMPSDFVHAGMDMFLAPAHHVLPRAVHTALEVVNLNVCARKLQMWQAIIFLVVY